MEIKIYFSDSSLTYIKFEPEEDNSLFKSFFSNNFYGTMDGQYLVHTSSFIDSYNVVNNFFTENSENIKPSLSEDLKKFIKDLPSQDEKFLEDELEDDEIISRLVASGFKRSLKWFQLRNVKRLARSKCGADFSVPGAGKTTDALAFYYLKKQDKEKKLLIISPINAYLSWKDDIKECVNEPSDIVKIRGELKEIKSSLSSDEEFYWTNYHTLQDENKLQEIINFIIRNGNVTVVLDESHRAKGPDISQKINKLSPFPEYKLILTGTPMPQQVEDLKSQFSFLFPKNNLRSDDDLIDAFQPFYTRTTDDDLGLKDIDISFRKIKPYPAHEEFYETYIRQGLIDNLSLESIFQVKSIEYAYMRYIRFISNPRSIANITYDIDSDLSSAIDDEGDGAKFDAVVNRATELVNQGEKVLIWSSFVSNVEKLASRLDHFGAEFIHGGVKSESSFKEELELFDNWTEDELETREEKIRKFKEDSETRILVANPAAAAESMSLHYVCNYALYLDRTYNAAHYLQSQKRIHRLTEGVEHTKHIEIFWLDVIGSIDLLVNRRLAQKCHSMFKFLNESHLSKSWVNHSVDMYRNNLGHVANEFDQSYKDFLANPSQSPEEDLDNY